MNNRCYRADYDVVKDGETIGQTDEYFWDESDSNAVDAAKELAQYGVDYADIGHCGLDLVQVVEVDANEECLPEIRTVWW